MKTASLMAYFKKEKIVKLNTRIDLYKMLIQPIITYGLPSWSGTSNNQLKKLLTIERKWIRLCTCIPKSTPIAIQYQLAPFKTILQTRREIAIKFRENIKNHQNPAIKQIDQYLLPGRKIYPLQQWDNSYGLESGNDDDDYNDDG